MKLFGGLDNTPFDPCYHQSCDTVDNINYVALEKTSSGAAYVIYTLSQMSNIRSTLFEEK